MHVTALEPVGSVNSLGRFGSNGIKSTHQRCDTEVTEQAYGGRTPLPTTASWAATGFDSDSAIQAVSHGFSAYPNHRQPQRLKNRAPPPTNHRIC
jgi:hypothetical protein